MLIGLLALILVPVFSQDPEVPTDIFDAINLNKWLATFALLVSATTFISTFINGFLKTEKSVIRKLIAWVVCAILTVAGKLLGIGFVGELGWLMVLVTVALGGVGANGFFDVPGLQAFWYTIEALLGNLKAKEKLNP